MRFKKIAFENYKTYYGNQEIDLSLSNDDQEHGRNIILLGGLNGAGKTTILKAIRYALFGKRGITKEEQERLVANTINNTYFEEGGRDCSVSLSLQMDSGEEWRLKVKWRFDSRKKNTGEYREIFVKKSPASLEKKLNVTDLASFNYFIDRIIPYNAAPFFIFDGEEIKELITKQSSAEMKRAIHQITGLDSYKLLVSNLNTLESQLYKKLSSATNQDTVNQKQKELQSLEKDILKYEKYIKKTKKELQEVDESLAKVTDERNQKISSNSKSRETLVKKQAELATKLKLKKEEFETVYKDNILYIILSDEIKSLKSSLKKENDVKNKKIMRENALEPYNTFINNLLGKDIDPPLTKEQLNQIKKIGESVWLKEDNQSSEVKAPEIHDLSTRDQSILNSLPIKDRHLLYKIKEDLSKLIEKHQLMEQEILSAPESVNIEKESKQIAYLQEKRGVLNDNIRKAFKKLTPMKEQLTNVRNQLTRLTSSDVSSEELTKKLEYTTYTKEFAEEFLNEATQLKATMIRDEFEAMLKKLFRKTDEFDDVVFDINNYSIRLYNELGQEISILDRSAGEMQMISSALIWALIKASDLDLPMVIDTPLGRLDSVHRNNLIENYYKELSDQVIILSTDTEITKEYVDMMKNHSAKQYLLDYNEEHKYTLIRDGYFDIVEVN
ncbi:DNA sulfur modification protein DndD [Bacillus sp. SB49]|uniref:DNA sulfur modification protein DndD n=1 Tax=Bacillus sp. SB49 TaxID=1071080 RepID=UPI00040832C3|nr:DNA sulfur modification protein DndD [Bacillus sp. SB49]QHT48506.1 DNA sulfur modification protein DndD [Bacillus sp. SB49]